MIRERLLGVEVDIVTLSEAVERVHAWCLAPRRPCRFVVTPNVDHAVLLREDPALRVLYTDADLVIADGMPMVWASRLSGRRLSERVAGSDLVPALFEYPRQSELRVFLLGAAPGVAERAASNIHARYSHVRVVGTNSPDLGFEHRADDNRSIVQSINDARPHLLVVGLGAPKQEKWVHRHASQIECGVAICAGATIDFFAQHRRRAPPWMQRTGTEWLYRALSEPRRLVPRYAKDACYLPLLIYADWKSRQSVSDSV
jgi:N-acetylglucosaminyldiphosphoundecaprenol N-acetyl-beta-D-mannosaminyltransferase